MTDSTLYAWLERALDAWVAEDRETHRPVHGNRLDEYAMCGRTGPLDMEPVR